MSDEKQWHPRWLEMTGAPTQQGSRVLLHDAQEGIIIATRIDNGDNGDWELPEGGLAWFPTHWCPLPQKPRTSAPAPANAVLWASQREAGHHDGWHPNRATMQWERYRAGELVETQSFITADTWRAWPYASSQEEP